MGLVDTLLLNIFQTLRSIGVIYVSLLLFVTLIILSILKYKLTRGKVNPFSIDSIRPVSPIIQQKEKRDAILKQGFSTKKVPEHLDAIVIGSGIGGLSCGAILSKAGKKVLVLEQHDQAGGCCHTFIDKGYEFDVGIHYIGEMANHTLSRTFVDQITDGQLRWKETECVIDQVELGSGDKRSTYRIVKGRENMIAEIKKDFPDEHNAIDDFFKVGQECRRLYPQMFILKLIPLWLAKFIIKTGLIRLFTKLPKYCDISVGNYLDQITTNEKLKAVLSYSFGDLGTQPRELSLMMHAVLVQHYVHGGYYPVGGASEIAMNIIPVIEKSGGKVLVRANVTEVLIGSDNKVQGVKVTKGGESYNLYAPVVVSAAGIINTYQKMVPDTVTCKPELSKILSEVESGIGAISIFVGLEGTAKELDLKATNTWAFTDSNLDGSFDDFKALPSDEIGKSDIPLLFISFPSTKDPTWDERFPGKSNCTIVTLANFEWFKEWENERIMKRGEKYEELKMRLAEKAWGQTLRYFPQLEGKRKYIEAGTPLTNQFYIGSPKGEIYGIDHTVKRFSPLISSQLRPATPISGLYLTGQDITSCGFAGALYGGLLTASVVLKRNLMDDLICVTKEIRKNLRKIK